MIQHQYICCLCFALLLAVHLFSNLLLAPEWLLITALIALLLSTYTYT